MRLHLSMGARCYKVLLKRLLPGLFFTYTATLYANEPDLLDISLDELIKTKIVSAQTRIQQFNDASAAVSTMSAEEIRLYGYRNLGEILNGMRGLFVFDYAGLSSFSSRGFSRVSDSLNAFSYESRLLLLIDGRPIGDNQLTQLLLGQDQMLDVNLIERVEYVPSAGSVRFGNSAFLGSINIITKSGKSIHGAQLATGFGRSGENYQRMQYATSLPNDGELLVAYSKLSDLNQPQVNEVVNLDGSSTSSDNAPPGRLTLGNEQLFLKMKWSNWNLALLHSQPKSRSTLGQTDPAEGTETTQDFRNAISHSYFGLSYDKDLSAALKSSTHFYYAQRKLATGVSSVTRTDTFLGQSESLFSSNVTYYAAWYGLNQDITYQLNQAHTLLAGVGLRNDFKNRTDSSSESIDPFFGNFSNQLQSSARRASATVYLHDDFQMTPTVKAGLGARYDANSQQNRHWSPRLSLNWQATPVTQLKVTRSLTHRDPTQNELEGGDLSLGRQERLDMSEVVAQYQPDSNTSLVLALFRYDIQDSLDTSISSINARGQEFEFTKQWESGLRTRFSVAHQTSESDLENERSFSPEYISKFNLAIPFNMLGKRAYLGWDSCFISHYLNASGSKHGNQVISNITLNLPKIANHLNVFATVRNAFEGEDHSGFFTSENGRSAWMQLEYQF